MPAEQLALFSPDALERCLRSQSTASMITSVAGSCPLWRLSSHVIAAATSRNISPTLLRAGRALQEWSPALLSSNSSISPARTSADRRIEAEASRDAGALRVKTRSASSLSRLAVTDIQEIG